MTGAKHLNMRRCSSRMLTLVVIGIWAVVLLRHLDSDRIAFSFS